MKKSTIILLLSLVLAVIGCKEKSPFCDDCEKPCVTCPGPACYVKEVITNFPPTFPVEGGTYSVEVKMSADSCLACSTVPVALPHGSTGKYEGGGKFVITVPPNAGNARSSSTAEFCGFKVTFPPQAGKPTDCTVTLNPTSLHFGAAGGEQTIHVSAPADCSWSEAFSADPWLTLLDRGDGKGDGVVVVKAQANNNPPPERRGKVNVADKDVPVSQDGTPVPTKMTLGWRVCKGPSSSPTQCVDVAAADLSSYMLERNMDYEIYVFVNHGRDSRCTISGTVKTNFLNDAGTSFFGPKNETEGPSPFWIDHAFNTRGGDAPGSSYGAPLDFTQACSGFPPYRLQKVVNFTIP